MPVNGNKPYPNTRREAVTLEQNAPCSHRSQDHAFIFSEVGNGRHTPPMCCEFHSKETPIRPAHEGRYYPSSNLSRSCILSPALNAVAPRSCIIISPPENAFAHQYCLHVNSSTNGSQEGIYWLVAPDALRIKTKQCCLRENEHMLCTIPRRNRSVSPTCSGRGLHDSHMSAIPTPTPLLTPSQPSMPHPLGSLAASNEASTSCSPGASFASNHPSTATKDFACPSYPTSTTSQATSGSNWQASSDSSRQPVSGILSANAVPKLATSTFTPGAFTSSDRAFPGAGPDTGRAVPRSILTSKSKRSIRHRCPGCRARRVRFSLDSNQDASALDISSILDVWAANSKAIEATTSREYSSLPDEFSIAPTDLPLADTSTTGTNTILPRDRSFGGFSPLPESPSVSSSPDYPLSRSESEGFNPSKRLKLNY
eukprot:Rmarinus@m.29385